MVWSDFARIADGVPKYEPRSRIAAIVADAATDQFLAWMDDDRKITPLKALQGLLWHDGYASGELKTHLYPDAVAAINAWRKKGLRIFIYSSGSIGAQKLCFAHSVAGNLTTAIDDHFDTTPGAKNEAAPYAKIAAAIGVTPDSILFLTDAPGEVAAARAAGLQVRRIERSHAPALVGEDGAVLGSFVTLLRA